MVPVTVMLYVEDLGRKEKPPPHPEIAVLAPKPAARNSTRARNRRRRLRGMKMNATRARTGAADGHADRPFEASGDAVWIVSVALAEVLPGVILDCEKLAAAPGGSPDAARVTAGMVAPFCAVT